jgi:hypothetical protein
MWVLGPLGFTTPLLLLGLLALPVLWFLLRAVPPAPIRRRFPGVALLLGLTDDDTETDRTPWWLLLLRMLALAAAIIAFAGPVLNPKPHQPGTGPLLILLDGGWADARDWPRRIDRAALLLEEAGRDGRPVAVLRLTDSAATAPLTFQTADAWAGRLAALSPQPWLPQDMAAVAQSLPDTAFDTFWLSDGLDHPGRAALFDALSSRGSVTLFQSPRPVLALHPARFADGAVQLAASRQPAADAVSVEVVARGPDPAGRGADQRQPSAHRAGNRDRGDRARPRSCRDRPRTGPRHARLRRWRRPGRGGAVPAARTSQPHHRISHRGHPLHRRGQPDR